MQLSKILDVLYSETFDEKKIINVLNKATYVDEYINDDNSLLIQLGFSFFIQTGKTFELFYDFSSKQLIFQMRFEDSRLPCILGLACEKVNKFIKRTAPLFIIGITEDEEVLNQYISTNDKIILNQLDHSVFLILERNTEDEFISIAEYPLNKFFNNKIYRGPDGFEIFRDGFKNRNFRDNENNETFSDNNFLDGTDGQLGDLGEEGWTSLGRD